MRPKSYGPIFASHSSTASPSGLGKDEIGLYRQEHLSVIRNKVSPVGHQSKRWCIGKIVVLDLRVGASRSLAIDQFFSDSQSVVTKTSKSTVWSGSQALH